MNQDFSVNKWDQVIEPTNKLFDLKLKELWKYRDLLMLFVRRDLIAVYKQTILGPIWHIIQPILIALVFTLIFGEIAHISTDGLPKIVFYLSGIVSWQYFSSCLTKTSNIFVQNANIFGKVYFPRLVVPFSVTISGLLSFFIQYVVLLGFIFYFYSNGVVFHPNKYLILIPFLILLIAILGMGLGLIISALTTKYKDLQFLVSFGVQLLLYFTPVIVPISSFPAVLQKYLLLNPLTAIVEGFRYGLFGVGGFDSRYLLYSTVVSVVVFFVGIILFNRIEKNFMDTV